VELMLKSQSFWEKAHKERHHRYAMESGRCFRAAHSIVLDGLRSGDLPSGRMPAEQITFSMAAITMGSHIMARNRQLAVMAGIDDPVTVVRQNQDLVLDGLGWKPLSAEWDYAATDQRIKKEIFPEVTWLKM